MGTPGPEGLRGASSGGIGGGLPRGPRAVILIWKYRPGMRERRGRILLAFGEESWIHTLRRGPLPGVPSLALCHSGLEGTWQICLEWPRGGRRESLPGPPGVAAELQVSSP